MHAHGVEALLGRSFERVRCRLHNTPFEAAWRLGAKPFRWQCTDHEFHRFLRLLHALDHASPEEVRQYQWAQLALTVRTAYDQSPFFKAKYSKAGFHPSDLHSWEDFSRLPFLTKEEVRENGLQMLTRPVSASVIAGGTSGTTGKALNLYYSRECVSRDWAALCYLWSQVGYTYKVGRIELRGFIPSGEEYRHFADDRVFRVNIIRMDTGNIGRLVSRIRKTGYHFLHGYPSAVLRFGELIRETGQALKPKAIMLASEVVHDWVLARIRVLFPGVPLTAHYGLAERTALGVLRDDEYYHFLPAYGYVEVDPVTHELITTGLLNEVMPFLRYRTTDVAGEIVEDSSCLRHTLYPVIRRIEGRLEDFTYTTSGNVVPPPVVTFPFKSLRHIANCQLVQRDLRHFELKAEGREDAATQEEARRLTSDLQSIYGRDAIFTVTIKEKLALAPSGKFRWIECRYSPRGASRCAG